MFMLAKPERESMDVLILVYCLEIALEQYVVGWKPTILKNNHERQRAIQHLAERPPRSLVIYGVFSNRLICIHQPCVRHERSRPLPSARLPSRHETCR